MSDYQTVTVKAVDKKNVTLEVVEESGDSNALASLFDEAAEKEDWLKIGAMLLLEDKARSGDVDAPEDDSPTPEHFVAEVAKIDATPIGKGNANNTRYRAVLRIQLVRSQDVKLFEVGQTWGAVADINGDFDNLFN